MRNTLLLSALLVACASAHSQSSSMRPVRIATPALRTIPKAPVGAEAREQRLLAQLSPSARDWVASEARRLGPNVNAATARAAVKARFPALSANADIDTLMFLVMMACTRESQSALREQMAAMQAVNHDKQAQREVLSREKMDAMADSKADVSELDQMKLQPYIEQRQKAFETLSNLMKKVSDTASTLVSNLK